MTSLSEEDIKRILEISNGLHYNMIHLKHLKETGGTKFDFKIPEHVRWDNA